MQPATAPEYDAANDVPTAVIPVGDVVVVANVDNDSWNESNYRTKGVMTVDDYHIVFVRKDHPVITLLRAGNMVDESTLIDGYYKFQEAVFNAGINLLSVDESEDEEEELEVEEVSVI
jgi:hypothetical protein